MSSLIPLSACRKPTRALLSIRPEYAEAILAGRKKYEFRRSTFARPVDVVLIYVTVPVHRVVAEFDVRSVVTEPIDALWRETGLSAGIDEQTFFRYFDGKDYGHAIEIGEMRPYVVPFCPMEVLGIRPPQSFAYLSCDQDTPATAKGKLKKTAMAAVQRLVSSRNKGRCVTSLRPNIA